jgi:hypothetical protein
MIGASHKDMGTSQFIKGDVEQSETEEILSL